jgi:hypothetical protein
VTRGGTGLGDELAMEDFTDQVLRQVEEVFISGETAGGGVHKRKSIESMVGLMSDMGANRM